MAKDLQQWWVNETSVTRCWDLFTLTLCLLFAWFLFLGLGGLISKPSLQTLRNWSLPLLRCDIHLCVWCHQSMSLWRVEWTWIDDDQVVWGAGQEWNCDIRVYPLNPLLCGSKRATTIFIVVLDIQYSLNLLSKSFLKLNISNHCLDMLNWYDLDVHTTFSGCLNLYEVIRVDLTVNLTSLKLRQAHLTVPITTLPKI